MKSEEAIEKLRYPELPDGLLMVGLEVRQEAIKALEKQIPKKVTNLKEFYINFGNEQKLKVGGYGDCPICNNSLCSIVDYCNKCGQRLDWSK